MLIMSPKFNRNNLTAGVWENHMQMNNNSSFAIKLTVTRTVYHSNKLRIALQLKPNNHSARLDIALRFQARIQVEELWASHILRTDEAHFR
ncbi:hypothetical protein NPIL_650311 [Nephila pilipes]|uniref:Uncharacterized protein n=1 Tax=Nephila pilipes TaxID=299642 RepID=A0A8X6QWA3_NEPPI|nr:hypothetical protein NPIL_650311 [Nephila pilipes]